MKKLLFGLVLSVLCAAGILPCSYAAPLGLPEVAVPQDNPQTPEKVKLGEQLFNDKRFSADGTISCASCHDPQKAFADGVPLAVDIKGQKGTRNSPTVLNAAFYTTQFWDGRVKSLEEQAKGPFINPVEHGLSSHKPILEVVRSDPEYLRQFSKVFGIKGEEIEIEHVVKAIAAFERTLITGDSPFDRYQYGGDKGAMSEAAIRGLEIYRTKARCQDCHPIGQNSAIFTDNKFHNLGVGFSVIQDNLFEIVERFRSSKEAGRDIDESVLTSKEVSELGRFAVTLDIQDIGRFKTPTLRNVALTAPYMHDGSIETMEEVIELYDQGGEENPMLDSGIRPLKLTDREKADLLEFLKALTSSGLKALDDNNQ